MADAKIHRMTNPDKISDDDLLSAIGRGDEQAFVTLYRRRQATIYRFSLQMSGSPALAEDVTQEVFMILMRSTLAYDPNRGPLSAFMIGVARNLIRQRMGREQIYVPIEDEAGEGSVSERAASDDNPLESLSRGEAIETIRRAVLSLPPRYREVVVLCELQELSYADAASVLDCAVGTVRSRLHRARAMLTEKVRPKSMTESPERAAEARCFA